MAIDAVVDSVRRSKNKTQLWLRRRVADGQASIAGRRQISITKNPDYEPQTGDEVWGNAHQVVISKNGVDHKFGRIFQLWNDTEQILWE